MSLQAIYATIVVYQHSRVNSKAVPSEYLGCIRIIFLYPTCDFRKVHLCLFIPLSYDLCVQGIYFRMTLNPQAVVEENDKQKNNFRDLVEWKQSCASLVKNQWTWPWDVKECRERKLRLGNNQACLVSVVIILRLSSFLYERQIQPRYWQCFRNNVWAVWPIPL